MRKTLCLILPILAGLITSCSTTRESGTTTQAIDLFNGRDLSGWKATLAKPEVKLTDVWSVRDGAIVCKGEPLGFIETERAFTNFQLVVEWRWAPGKKPGNSGVFLRINGDRKPLPRCIECQLKSGDAGDVYGFHTMGIDGDKARRVEKKGHELGGDFIGVKKLNHNENPPGQWNRYELELRGGNLFVKVNGLLVNEAKNCEILAGPIGLQSEGGEVHFRRVRVTPLP
jgi:hypothetical protein